MMIAWSPQRVSQRPRAVRIGFLLGVALLVSADRVEAAEPAPRTDDRNAQPFAMNMVPSIQAMTVDQDQTVYAGSFGLGVFRSTDRGATWVPMSEGLPDPFILALTASPDGTIYVGTIKAGVFRTRNGGKSWEALNEGLKRLEIKALLVSGGHLYAGTGDGVYTFTPGRDRWKVVTGGLSDVLVHTLAMSPDGTLYAGTSGKGVHRYKAGTAQRQWTRLSRGLIDHEGMIENFIRVLAVDKDRAIYLGTFDGGVFQSGDGGESWRPISRALPNDSIRGIITNDRGLFVATGRGVYKSVNQGRQWTSANHGLTELSVQVLVDGGAGTLYAGTSSGAFRSDDDGRTWVGISRGLEGPMIGFPF